MKQAACIYIERFDKQVLVINRFNTNQFGLIGGAVDPNGESPLEAAIREVREETGLDLFDININNFIKVYAERRPSGVYSESFYLRLPNSMSFNKLTSSSEGTVSWADRSVLMNGPYAAYNYRLMEVLTTLGYI